MKKLFLAVNVALLVAILGLFCLLVWKSGGVKKELESRLSVLGAPFGLENFKCSGLFSIICRASKDGREVEVDFSEDIVKGKDKDGVESHIRGILENFAKEGANEQN